MGYYYASITRLKLSRSAPEEVKKSLQKLVEDGCIDTSLFINDEIAESLNWLASQNNCVYLNWSKNAIIDKEDKPYLEIILVGTGKRLSFEVLLPAIKFLLPYLTLQDGDILIHRVGEDGPVADFLYLDEGKVLTVDTDGMKFRRCSFDSYVTDCYHPHNDPNFEPSEVVSEIPWTYEELEEYNTNLEKEKQQDNNSPYGFH